MRVEAVDDKLYGNGVQEHASAAGAFRAGSPPHRQSTTKQWKRASRAAGHGTIDWTGVKSRTLDCGPASTIFSQGDPASTVLYIEAGAVRLSVLSPGGKEAVVALLEAGDFLGEGCLAGQSKRMATATAMNRCRIVAIPAQEMMWQLHCEATFTDRFLAHMLKRNIRVEEDLLDHLFNSSEKRLARTLLLLAREDDRGMSARLTPRFSQELLAEMVGTTRARVNVFMNKFRKLGFIDYKRSGRVTINASLIGVVLGDRSTGQPSGDRRFP